MKEKLLDYPLHLLSLLLGLALVSGLLQGWISFFALKGPWIETLHSGVLVGLALWGLMVLARRSGWSGWGYTWQPGQAFFGVLIGSALLALGWLGSIVLGAAQWVNMGVALSSVPILILACCVAALEEFFFRGWLLEYAKSWGRWAVFFQALVFALSHHLVADAPSILVMQYLGLFWAGVVLGLLRVRSGSLLLCWGVHASWIALTQLSVYHQWLIFDEGARLWSGAENPLHGVVMISVLLVLSAVLLVPQSHGKMQ